MGAIWAWPEKNSMNQLSDRFQIDAEVPKEVAAALNEYLPALEWLIPSWCQLVKFFWVKDTNGESLSANISYEYRWASIFVTGNWLNQNPLQRREDLIHELLHISVGPLADYAKGTINLLLGEEAPKFNKHAENELRVRHEIVVQELAYILNRRMPHGDS